MNDAVLTASDAPPGRARRERRNRALTITLLVSVGLHLAAVTAGLLLLHTGAAPVADGPEKPTEVELVMEERKGDVHPTQIPQPSADTRPPRQSADKTETSRPAETPAPTPPTERPPETPALTQQAAANVGAETVPPPVQVAAQAATQPATPETPPPAPEAMKITLEGTDSPSDAKAWGDRIIPAAPDAVFHNRPPVYPDEAAMKGQQGTVVVVIHVSPAGRAAGVDVTRSSGYVLLDRAAAEAVARWRFLPAVRDGQPVASDMTMGFIFANR